MAMHLYLTGPSCLDGTYTNHSGHPIYKVHTTYTHTLKSAHTTTISHGDPNSSPALDRSAHLAQIDWHSASSSHIRFGGADLNTKKFFKREGWSWKSYGRDRIFTAPGNGREYKWVMDLKTSSLITNDDSKTPVARFNNAEELGTLLTGPKSTSAPSSLEIFPAGEHMVDLIVVTFVYVEKLRKEREKAADEAA